MWILKRYYAEETGGDASSGGGSAVSAPAEGLDDSSSDSDVNWGDLDTSFDALDVEGDMEILGEEPPTPASEEPPAPTAPAQAAPQAPAPTAPTSPAGQVPNQAPAATPPQVAQAPQSAPPPQTQESAASAGAHSPEVYQNWRAARLGDLEKHYTFSEDESAALLTEPEVVLPKLAAKLHMEVLENSMRAMQAMVPVMMEQVQQHKQVEGQAKNLFSSINPDLADPRLEPVIMQLGMTYRQMNRSAGPEEASRAIGNLVRAALNMPAPSAPQATPPAAAAPVAPFAPVRGGGGGTRPAQSSNQFEQLASEMLSEDNDW